MNRVKVGQRVTRVPITISDIDPKTMKRIVRPMRGVVDFVHPQGRYHTVAFDTPGGVIKESFLGVE